MTKVLSQVLKCKMHDVLGGAHAAQVPSVCWAMAHVIGVLRGCQRC